MGGGGITGDMYEPGALSAMGDFIVSGRKSGEPNPPGSAAEERELPKDRVVP
jgi:hypothetical protein